MPYALAPETPPGRIERFVPEQLTGNVLEGLPFFGGVFALMLGVLGSAASTAGTR